MILEQFLTHLTNLDLLLISVSLILSELIVRPMMEYFIEEYVHKTVKGIIELRNEIREERSKL